ncbi:hypothetical protein ACHAWF_002364 [Thalassiosira exigua]
MHRRCLIDMATRLFRFAGVGNLDKDEEDLDDRMRDMGVDGGDKKSKEKQWGATAKNVHKANKRVIVQKISLNKRKAVTHVVDRDTMPGIKLKDVRNAFSKRFVGISSIKGMDIIIQGDHIVVVVEMIVTKFGVSGDAVFLDLNGEFVPFGG